VGFFFLAIEQEAESAFLDQLNDPFAEANGELEVPEEVEPQQTVYPTFCRQIMA